MGKLTVILGVFVFCLIPVLFHKLDPVLVLSMLREFRNRGGGVRSEVLRPQTYQKLSAVRVGMLRLHLDRMQDMVDDEGAGGGYEDLLYSIWLGVAPQLVDFVYSKTYKDNNEHNYNNYTMTALSPDGSALFIERYDVRDSANFNSLKLWRPTNSCQLKFETIVTHTDENIVVVVVSRLEVLLIDPNPDHIRTVRRYNPFADGGPVAMSDLPVVANIPDFIDEIRWGRFDSKGRLLVCGKFGNVWQCDLPFGEWKLVLTLLDAEGNPFTPDYCMPTKMCSVPGTDDFLIPYARGTIVKYKVGCNQGVVVGKAGLPSSVFADSNGMAYVADMHGAVICPVDVNSEISPIIVRIQRHVGTSRIVIYTFIEYVWIEESRVDSSCLRMFVSAYGLTYDLQRRIMTKDECFIAEYLPIWE